MRTRRLARLPSLVAALALAIGVTAVAATPAVALETPLVLTSGSVTAVIDPGLGTLTTFEVQDRQSIRKNFINWLMDLDQLEKRVFDERNGETFSYLRVGSPKTMRPTSEEMIQAYSDDVTKQMKEQNQTSLRSQVREAEKAFWAEPAAYDGMVHGALNGDFLMLVIPSRRAILVYKNSGRDSMDLFGWSSYSPMLYMPGAWKSQPAPEAIINQIASEQGLDEADKKALQGALAPRDDGKAPAAAKSEIWVAAVSGAFMIVDAANQKIWSYEIKGQALEMTSIRSMAADLMIPGGYNTQPALAQAVTEFAKSAGGQLKALGIEKFDVPWLQAFTRASRVGDSAKAGKIQANSTSSTAVLSFTAQNKVLTYTYVSGQGIELGSARDTTIDQGLTLLQRRMRERAYARDALATAAKAKQPGPALSNLTFALANDPSLHKEAGKLSSLKNLLKADFDRLLADAAAAQEKQVAKDAEIEQAAEAERQRLKDKKKSGK